MATIDLKGPTEMTDFAKDVSELYADDLKIDETEIKKLKEKYVDYFFYFDGAGEIDTAEEIDAVVCDINFDGKADDQCWEREYSSLTVGSSVESFPDYRSTPAYDRTVFSDDFITMVQSEIGSKPLDRVMPPPREIVKEKALADFKDITQKVLSEYTSKDYHSEMIAKHDLLSLDDRFLIADHEKLVTPETVQAMMGLLKNPATHATPRKNAALFLRTLNTPEINKQFLEIATDPAQSEDVSNLAMESLKYIGLERHEPVYDFLLHIKIKTSDREYFEERLNAILKDHTASQEKKDVVWDIARYGVNLVDDKGVSTHSFLKVPQ